MPRLIIALFTICLALWYGHFLSRQPKANLSAAGMSNSVGEDPQEESRLLAHIRQVTFAGARAGEGYFSQDGVLMIFQSEREPANPFFQIYVMDLQNGDTRRVSPGYGKTTCAWIHPSKEKILFASTHEDPQARAKQQAELELRASGQVRRYTWDFDEYFDLFEADLHGRSVRNLTATRGYDAEAAWSPDGTRIVFASNRHAYTEQLSEEEKALFERDPSSLVDLYIMAADGTQLRRLTETKGYDGGPFFSADGQQIVWRRFSAEGASAEIFTMNVDGTEQKQITRLGAMSWAPYFHPSGEYLIFATNLHGMSNFELYVVDSAGNSQPVRVTYTDGFDGLPVFTPDGRRLSWTSNRTATKQSQIFFAEWHDDEARRLLGLEEGKQGSPAAVPVSSLSSVDPSQSAPLVPEMNSEKLRRHITVLAAEDMKGRLTGTEGELRATAYGASVFESLGLSPAGDNGTFFQTFEFTAGVSLGSANQLALYGGDGPRLQEYGVDTEWRPLAFSKTGRVEPAAVVFAGYGIVAPAADGIEAYDSFVDLDVTDKWVLVFRYLPEKITPECRRYLNRYANLRYKAMLARDRGARGLIVMSGPNSQVHEPLVKLSFDASLTGTSIAAISVTDALAVQLLHPSGKSLQALQDVLDSGNSFPGFPIPNLALGATIDVQYEKRTGRNVLARLHADGATRNGLVVIGAHVDHLGDGVGTGSLARGNEKDKVHYGADDNASGVAGVLEIARYLVAQKARGTLSLQRDALFALWSGEEIGLLGSSHFTRTFGTSGNERSVLSPDIVAYLNMDMIGRLEKTLVLQGVGSSSLWLSEIERHNAPIGLAITVQNDSYLPTDATAFYLKGVPILSAFTGAHEDYHTPKDTADKINYTGVEKIASLMASLARSLATREEMPDYRIVEKPNSPPGRVSLRAYLGTIPDYAQTDVVGVRLSGVAAGGPADQAGLQGGDIIVELAGKKIENIYDYTYSVDSLQIGAPIPLVVQRGEQRLTLTVTPQSRE